MRLGVFLSLVTTLLPTLVGTGCGKLNTMNSVASDAQLYAGGGTSEFRAVQTVVIQKCASCHYHTEFAYYSEQDFIDLGFVVPQDPPGSLLYSRLDGSGGVGGMPVDDALTAAELQAFEDWILSLTP